MAMCKVQTFLCLSSLIALVGCREPTTTIPSPVTTTVPATDCTYRSGTSGEPLPDPVCTPGSLNPDVTQATISSTICKSGWTSTVRPPVSYTGPIKQQLMLKYHTADPSNRVELDHFIPLELGGAPSDIRNLWPEPPDPNSNSTGVNNKKDQVENAANKAVCAGRMLLSQAQDMMKQDWVQLGIQLGVLQ